MKSYQVNSQANQLQANLKMEEKTFMDLYAAVKAGDIVPVTDEEENIVGFNVVKAKPSMMKVCKMVNGAMTVGDTEEDRAADEVAMRTFLLEYPNQYQNMRWFLAAMTLIKAGIEPDDIIDDRGATYIVLAAKRQVLDLEGNVVVDLSDDEDIEEGTPTKIVVKLLKAAFNSEF